MLFFVDNSEKALEGTRKEWMSVKDLTNRCCLQNEPWIEDISNFSNRRLL